MEDSFHWTFRNASFTVDALLWVNVKHLIAFVEALYGANNNTIGIAATNTRLGDNVCHVTDNLC